MQRAVYLELAMFEQIADGGRIVELRIDDRVTKLGPDLLVAGPHEQAVQEGIELECVDRHLELCEPSQLSGRPLKRACGDGWAVASPGEKAAATVVARGIRPDEERGTLHRATDVD